MTAAATIHIAVTDELHTIIAGRTRCKRQVSAQLIVAFWRSGAIPTQKVDRGVIMLSERYSLANVDEAGVST